MAPIGRATRSRRGRRLHRRQRGGGRMARLAATGTLPRAVDPVSNLCLCEAVADAHRRKGETPRIVVVYDQGRPVLLFPTVVGRFCGVPTIRFLGDPLIQYGDVLASPAATPAHYACRMALACRSGGGARYPAAHGPRRRKLVAPFLRTLPRRPGRPTRRSSTSRRFDPVNSPCEQGQATSPPSGEARKAGITGAYRRGSQSGTGRGARLQAFVACRTKLQ